MCGRCVENARRGIAKFVGLGGQVMDMPQFIVTANVDGFLENNQVIGAASAVVPEPSSSFCWRLARSQ